MKRTLSQKLKKSVSAILAAAMSISLFTTIPVSADIGKTTYNYDGYSVDYNVTNEWDGAQTVELTVSNTGTDSILNWALSYDAEGEISNLWNANLYEQNGDEYVIKNAGWNFEIAPNQSVTYGYTLSGNDLTLPKNFEIYSKRVDKTEGYDVQYNITKSWDVGVEGNIVITNTSPAPIEAWTLSFDSNFTIGNLWNGRVLENNGTSYTVAAEMWTNPVQPNGSMTIGFVGSKAADVEALLSNFRLTEVVIGEGGIITPDPKLEITANAVYDEENGNIYVSWTSNKQDGTFDVLMSEDGENFVSVDTVESVSEFVYTPENDFETLYFKVVQTVGEQTAESNLLIITKTGEEIDWNDETDTDNDGLIDVYEKYYYKTDPENPDTDGDGLLDGYEVCTLGTDPLKIDSDDNGIADGEEDFDSDGLLNYFEYEMGTNPNNSDTDDDGLSDNDEVNIYNTNPLIPDTDGDGILDGDEIPLGLNPTLYSTFGDGVCDSDRFLEQTSIKSVESHDNAVTKVIVEMNTTGYIDRNLKVKSMYNIDMLSTDVVGLIGDPFNLSISTEFSEAKLTFTIDKTKLGETDFEDLLFLWFDEENQNFVELETIIDEANATVSTITTHFSQYMIVDGKKWFAVWSGNQYNDMAFNDLPYQPNAIGVSSTLPSSKQNALSLSKSFGDSNYLLIETANMNWQQAQQFCESYGGHLATVTTSSENAFIFDLMNNGTKTWYWIGGVWDANQSPKWITGEKFNSSIGKFTDLWGSSLSGHLGGYRNINGYASGIWHKGRTVDSPIENYVPLSFICEWDKKIILLDSDEDGLPDIYETRGMPLANGTIIYTNPNNSDTDGDTLIDGIELSPIIRSCTVLTTNLQNGNWTNIPKTKYFFEMGSNPTKNDTDNDGINDYDETNGVSYTSPNGTTKTYDGDPLHKGLAYGIVGNLTIVSDNSSQAKFWNGHAFLLYESYINDTLDFSGFARGFKFTEDDDGTIKNNWNEMPIGYYKISPNRVISIGNYSSGDDGWADIFGSSGSGSSDSSDSSGSGSSTGEGNGIHFNMELRLLYSSKDGTEDGEYVRSYGNNAALTQDITAEQLESMLEYQNSVDHYNFIGNNCAEIAGKSWNIVFDDNINFRIWLSTPTPAALKKSIKKCSESYKITFHSDEWTKYINREVVNW